MAWPPQARILEVYGPFHQRLGALFADYTTAEIAVLADWFTRAKGADAGVTGRDPRALSPEPSTRTSDLGPRASGLRPQAVAGASTGTGANRPASGRTASTSSIGASSAQRYEPAPAIAPTRGEPIRKPT